MTEDGSSDPTFRTAVDRHLTTLINDMRKVAARLQALEEKAPQGSCPPHGYQVILGSVYTDNKYKLFCSYCADVKEV